MTIGSDHDLYDHDPFTGRRERHARPHPLMQAQLLDPTSWMWQRGDIYLRLFPDELRYCLGERLLRMYDATLPQSARSQARIELRKLRESTSRYFKRTARPVGRPPKLTQKQREEMSAEHDRLRNLVRKVVGEKSPAQETLNHLFRDREFLKALFEAFPRQVVADPAAWNQFLRESATLPLAERCVHYLAYQYGVSPDTIRDAVW